MFDSRYRKEFNGIAIGRVLRNQDFTAPLGFYKNEYEIQYLFGGKRLYFINGCCYVMETGSIALIDKKKIPKTCIIGGQYHDRMLVELKGDLLIQTGALLGADFEQLFRDYYGVYHLNECPRVREIFLALETLAVSDRTVFQELKVKNKVLELLALIPGLGRYRADEHAGRNVEASVSKQMRVHEVADYIAHNYARIQSVDELAGHFYISKSYLCRVFKEVINFTISEYINLHRIAAGRQILMEDSYSLTEVAGMLGYSSLTYFERVFKNEMSVTPGEYRKILRKKHGSGNKS